MIQMVFYLLIYFFYLFAEDHQLLQYFIHHCDSIEQEVSEAFLGLLRRPPLLLLRTQAISVKLFYTMNCVKLAF